MKVIPSFRPLKLAFCPTGSGGGQDNSCGSSSGGADTKVSAARSEAKAASAKAVAASRAINITNGHKQILSDIEQHMAAGKIGYASSQHYRAVLEHQKATQAAVPYKTKEHLEATKFHWEAIKKLDPLKELKGGLGV